MISVDQNCHSLWDTVPKLHALARRGQRVRHYIEDIDVAFTALGAAPGEPLTLDRERYHHSGGAWWGAALFYSEFLGRLPVDPRRWEPITGMKTAALARKLGRSVEDLYAEFSPSDNWQLVGPSYVGDADHHRVIGDLTVAETAPFVREILDKAAADMLRAFPAVASRGRLTAWLAGERGFVDRLLAEHAAGQLTDVYHAWMRRHLGEATDLDVAGQLFACDGRADRTALLDAFLADYDRLAGLYNESLTETGSEFRPLLARRGELPYFAVIQRDAHRVRTGLSLVGNEIRIGERTFPLAPGRRTPTEALAAAGVQALPPKAVLLAIQVRIGQAGQPLALPHKGSLYMPTVHCFAGKLAAAGLLPDELRPIVRVRFRLLDRLRALTAPIRLPRHLAEALGETEVPARRLGEAWESLVAEAADRLSTLADKDARQRWQAQAHPKLSADLAGLNARRRELAAGDATPAELRALSQQAKALQVELLTRTVHQIDRDWQVRELDYWDSRGALLPWCVALGGEDFYNAVLEQAEVYEESPR